MKKNAALAIIGLLAAIGFVVAIGFGTNNTSKTIPTGSSVTQNAQSNSTSDSQKYSASDVAKHSTKSDCWTIVDGGVYNITSYISEHPGGSEILQACGIDATQMFKGMGAKGRNNAHSQDARDILSGLQIGTLSN